MMIRSKRAQRLPTPPFSRNAATSKVRIAEDAWNTGDAEQASLANAGDSSRRNRGEFLVGCGAITAFLRRKWTRGLDYRLINEPCAYAGDRVAVRFTYEWRHDSGSRYRRHGDENWEFDERGRMRLHIASTNDELIGEAARKFHWPQGPRPGDHPGRSALGL